MNILSLVLLYRAPNMFLSITKICIKTLFSPV